MKTKNEPKKMTDNEMMRFIKDIGRAELFDEVKHGRDYPKYLKAVRVSLISLGYDFDWVENDFRKAVEAYYEVV